MFVCLISFIIIILFFACDKKNEDKLSTADCMKKISEIETKIYNLEKILKDYSKDPYLKVVNKSVYIRSRADETTSENIIAIAQAGAYLRKISCVDPVNNENNTRCKWYKVQYLVDIYPYNGYINANPEYTTEEYFDPLTASNVYKRGLVIFLWEKELLIELIRKDIKIVAIAFNVQSPFRSDRLLGKLSKLLRAEEIYLKPMEMKSIDKSKIDKVCIDNSVDGVILVDMVIEKNNSGYLLVYLFNNSGILLYSTHVPFEAVENDWTY